LELEEPLLELLQLLLLLELQVKLLVQRGRRLELMLLRKRE
jgi:hypothetical protein